MKGKWARRIAVVAVASAGLLAGATPAYATEISPLSQFAQLSSTSYGGNAGISIDLGQIAYLGSCTEGGGTPDFLFPFTDVYIVPVGSVSNGSTLHDVRGKPRTLGPLFSGVILDELIGVTKPTGKVPPGDYAIVFDECQDGKFTPGEDYLLDPAFSVHFDPTNVPPLSPAIAQLKKAAAKQAADQLLLLDIVNKVEAIQQMKEAIECLEGGVLGCAASMAVDAIESAIKAKLMQYAGLVDPVEAAKLYVNNSAKAYTSIFNDPPDLLFQQLDPIPPVAPLDPQSNDPLLRALADLGTSAANQSAIGASMLHSMERYQGAQGVGDGTWALLHARTLSDNATLLSAQLTQSDSTLDTFSAAVHASSIHFDTVAPQLEALRAQIASGGFTPAERAAGMNLGATRADLAALLAKLQAADFSFSTTALDAEIATIKTDNQEARNADVATQALLAPTITQLVADPTVSVSAPEAKAGGPYTVPEGAPKAIEGDGSIAHGTPIVSYQWDFNGDGNFDDATGDIPNFTPPHEGQYVLGLKVTDADGNTSVGYALLTATNVTNPPTINSFAPTGALHPDVGTPTTFSVAATDPEGDPISYQWQVDAQNVVGATSNSFVYTPTVAGAHIVRLIASDGTTGGGSNTHEWTVDAVAPDADGDGYHANADCNDANPSVNPGHKEVIGNGVDDDCDPGTPDTGSPPTAGYSTPYSTATVGLPFQFTDTSTDPDDDIVSYQWSFGDLSPFATTRSPMHTYLLAGTYNVELIVTDSQGHTSAKSTAIQADSAPLASFTYAPPAPDVVTSVHFTDTSVDPDSGDSIVSRSWDFGDGATSTDSAPAHTYAMPGSYVVVLTVTDSHGLAATTAELVTVANIPNPPVAAFTYLPTSPTAEAPVQFTDASTDPGGTIASWAWDFGDGSTSLQESPSHAFATTGAYLVKLAITDNRGARVSSSQTLTVSTAQPVASFVPGSESNVALSEDGASIVSFSSQYSTGYPASTFIDASPTNSYWATNGTTTATTVIALAGTRAWQIDKVFLRPNNICCLGERVRDFAVDVSTDGTTFTNVLNATAADDGNLQEFDLLAPVAARYVRYRALNNRGSGCCVSQQQFKAMTFERGAATVTFTNTSHGADSYAWSFGDGSAPSTDTSPTHHFVAPGTYHVTLTATKGATSSVASTDYEVAGVAAAFTSSPAAPVVDSAVAFTDASTPAGSISAWSWDFGDATSSTLQSPSHVYSQTGSYHVTLRTTDTAGRQDSVVHDVTVAAPSGTTARFVPVSGGGNVGSAAAGTTVDAFSSQYNSDYRPSTLLDSGLGTYYWATQGGVFDGWVKLTLPAANRYLIDRVGIRPVACCPDQRVTHAEIAVSTVSDADADFTTVLNTPLADNSNLQEFPIRPVSAKYVRYTAHNEHPSCCVSTRQLQLFTPQYGGPHVSLRNDSTNATSYLWNFGDGSTSTEASPSHTYAAPGAYAITLTATGSSGFDTYSLSYTDNGPTAGFSYTPVSALPNAPLQFTDGSTLIGGAAITSWSWDFGDGTISTLPNPVHTFFANGTFSVALRVRDANGWGDLVTRTVVVGTGTAGPAAFFAPYPKNGGRNVALYDTGARTTRSSGNYPGCCDPDQMLKAVPQNYWATPPGQVTNGYAVVGLAGSLTGPWLINRVEVGSDGICCGDQRVRDFAVDSGLLDADAAFAQVASGTADTSTGIVRSVALDRPVSARFLRYRPLNDAAAYCCISTRQFRAFTGQEGGREVTFKNFTTGATSYSWSFGDLASGLANVSTDASPTHVFSAPGTYHVTLTASDGAGHTDTSTADQVVLPQPVVTIKGPSNGFRGRAASFYGTIQVPVGVSVLATSWDFGDGTSSGGSSASHTYANDGTYTVRFDVVDSNGQTTEATQALVVAASTPAGAGFTSATQWVTGIPSPCCNVGPVGMAWDEAGRLIVSDFYTGDLYRFGEGGGVADAAHRLNGSPLPGNLLGLAFDRGGRLYATRSSYGDVVEIDQSTWTIKRVVASGIGCVASIAADPLSGDLFVGDCGGIVRLTGFAAGAATVTRFASVGSMRQFVFAPDGTIYGTQWYSNILKIEGTGSLTPGAVSTLYADLREVDGIALGPSTGLPGTPPVIYVNRNDGQITKLDFGIYPLAGTTIFTGGTRGAYESVGPDSCLYATQTTSIVKLTYANGDCALNQPAEPRLSLTAPLSTPSQHIGAHAVFTATVTNVASPGGITVKFEIAGPNAATYQATTDAAGRAAIELVGVHEGTDTVTASASVAGSAFSSNSATATWTAGAAAPVARFVPHPVGGGRNVALKEGGATIAAFSSQYNADHSPEAMIDYSSNEYYESPGGLPWATANGTGFDTNQFSVVKLPGSFLIDKVFVMPRKCCDTQRVRDFEISYSNSPTYDASSFVTVLRATAENAGRLQEFDLPQAVQATFIRYAPINNYGEGCCISTMQFRAITGQQGRADVQFENRTLDATTYHWDFGDGSSSGERNPTHHYTSPGAYPVTMTATNASGSSTLTLVQRVFAPPVASIVGPDKAFRNSVQTFTASAAGSGGSSIAEYRWNWGDGQTTLGQTVSHQWASDGTYTVTLRIADANDQSTTVTQQIVISPAAATGYAYTKWATGIPSGCCDIGPIGVAFDSGGRLWVADPYYNGGAIYRFGAGGGAADSSFVGYLGGAPHGIAFGRDGRLYVARRAWGDIVEIDQTTAAVVRVVASGIGCPTGLATDPISGDLFVTTTGCDATTIWRIGDPGGASPQKTPYLSNAGSADGITFAPDGTIYAAISNQIARVAGTNSPGRGGQVQFLLTLNQMDGIAVQPSALPGNEPTLYVNRNDGFITRVDLSTSPPSVTEALRGGTRGDFIAVGPDGCLYATQTTSVIRLTNADGSCILAPTSAQPQLTLRPAPSNPAPTTGATERFTAAVINAAGAGIPVTFTVAGANPGSFVATTDATGSATIEYTGTAVGTDTITATANVLGSSLSSNPATVTWSVTAAGPPVALFNPQTQENGRNVASREAGASATDSDHYDSNYVAQNMIDNDVSEYYEPPATGYGWATQNGHVADPHWAKIVLAPNAAGQSTYMLDRIRILGRRCCTDQGVRTFEVAVSTTTQDDAAFTTVLHATLDQNDKLQELILPRPVVAKYVRYTPIDNYGSGCCITTMAFRAITGQSGGRVVTFRNLSSNATSYDWDFGDGTAHSSGKNPTHTYAAAGIYHVTLIATNANGNTSYSLDQEVLDGPTGAFTWAPDPVKEGVATTFTSTAAPPAGATIARYVWNWGDGTSSTGASAAHTFIDNGAYDVTLETVDSRDQKAFTHQTVTVVNQPPTITLGPDWNWRKGRPWRDEAASVTDPGFRDTIVSCSWDFGDGTAPGACPSGFGPLTHTYAADGTYTVTVTATDNDGGVATGTLVVHVIPAAAPVGGSGGGGGSGGINTGTDVTYTHDAEFDHASLLNVNHDAPNADQLQLNEKAQPLPFVAIPGTNRGTMIRMNINTGQIVGEYWSSPAGRSRNPSRTTIDQRGNTWMTNRDEGDYVPSTGRYMGSIERVGVILGGTRANADGSANPTGEYLKPPFDYNTCVDRNGDGLIHTSNGYGNILPWTNDGGADNAGGVTTAADECLINYVRTFGTNARTVAIDKNNNLWVGGLGNQWHEEIDGVTGTHVPGTEFNLGCGGYGGFIDSHGILWSARGGGGLLRYDTNTHTGRCIGNGQGDYGLGLDPRTGDVWHTTLFGPPLGEVVKMDKDGNVLGRYSHGLSTAQGVAVDASGNVWVAHSLFGTPNVGHLRTNGSFVGNVSLLGETGPTGVAVDANGKVWTANNNTSSSSRIDPQIGPLVGGVPTGYVDLTVHFDSGCYANVGCLSGAYPYSYSDMTGFVSIGSTAPQGTWNVVQDAGAPGARWGKVTWNTEAAGFVPSGATIDVSARTSDSLAGLSSSPFVPVANGVTFAQTGRYVEVQTTLRANPAGQSPVLSDLRISLARTNASPIAGDGQATTNRSTSTGIHLAATDADNDPLTYTIIAPPLHGTLTGTAPDLTYLPTGDFAGPDSFTFLANDGHGDSNIATVSIYVTAPPVAIAVVSPNPADAGHVVAFDGTGSSDPDPARAIASWAWDFGGATATGATTTHVFSTSGDYPVTLTVSDDGSPVQTAATTVVVHVTASPPVVTDDSFSTHVSTPVAGDPLANDTDPEGRPLTIDVASVTSASNGVAQVTTNGFTYTPNPGFVGDDSFTYRATNGFAESQPATVTIHVTDRAPVAGDVHFTAIEGQALQVLDPGVLVNDSDPDGDAIRSLAVSQPAHGHVVLAFTGGFVYTPDAGFHGLDSFGYTLSDGALSSPGVVTVSVDGTPTAVDDTFATHFGTPLVLDGLAGNDTDPEREPLTVVTSSVTQPAHGTMVETATGWLYTPERGYVGPDSLRYAVTDGFSVSAPATVHLEVTDRAPTAVGDEYSVHAGQVLHVLVPGPLANDGDPDNDPVSVSSDGTQPLHGHYTLSAGGELIYTPDAGYVGDDSFTYRVTDGALKSAPATITVHVTDQPPIGVADSYEVHAGTSLHIDSPGVLSNDSDPESDPIQSTSVTQPANGRVVLAFAGGFDYTPNPGFVGDDSFTYIPNDGYRNGAPATVTIHVTDRAPVTVGDSYSTHANTTLTIAAPGVAGNDSDPDNDPFRTLIATPPTHGTVTLSYGGEVRYVPAHNYVGPDSFTYTATDGFLSSTPATVTLDVTDSPPVAGPDAARLAEDTTTTGNVLTNDADPDHDPLSVALVAAPQHGTATLSPDGTFTYAPDPNFNGTDTFTYVLTDGILSVPGTVTLTVTEVNDPPLARDDVTSLAEDTARSIDVLANDSPGPPNESAQHLTLASVGLPAHGTAAIAAGLLVYTPAANYNGPDSVTYRACDDGTTAGAADPRCATGSVAIDVTPVNDAPLARDGSISLNEDDPPVTIDLRPLARDLETPAANLSFAIVGGPTKGVLTGVGGIYSYDSNDNANGADSFTYRVTDRGDPDGCTPAGVHCAAAASATGTVAITIVPVNDPPVVSLSPAGPIDEGAAPVTLAATAADVDVARGESETFTYSWSADAGTVTPIGDGTHATFSADDGPATVHVTVKVCDDGTTNGLRDPKCATTTQTVVVRNVPPSVTATAVPTTQYWGLPVHFVGHATDPSTADTIFGFNYVWNFGDFVLSPPDNDVTHAYALPGTYTANFRASDKDGGLGSTNAPSVTIRKRGTSIAFTSPTTQPFGPTALVARLTDVVDAPTAQLTGRSITFTLNGRTYSALTDATGTAAVSPAPFLLSGAVHVAFAGDRLYTASFADVTLTIQNAFSGFFTLGDRSATLNAAVTFWGSQWWKINVLSASPAPSAFKGFVNSVTVPGCGGLWSTDPGNSSAPPDSVGPYVGVFVSSRMAQSGPVISGNTSHIVVVKTNPGYGPAPGHDGTGQVVAILC